MDLVAFHHDLFGSSDDTPAALQVSDLHQQLYHAFPAVRGVFFEGKDLEALPAVVIMALAQTRPRLLDTVFVLTPEDLGSWVLDGIRAAAKRILRCKKGDKDRQDFVRDTFGRIIVGHQFTVMPEPPQWVAIGIPRSTPSLPQWLTSRLIEIPRG